MSIEKLQKTGDDALVNLFQISIGTIGFLDTYLDSTVLRVQNFNVPGTGANTYEVHYKTQKMTKVGGKINAPNEFSFDFRVDRNWKLYAGFTAWKNAVANSSTGVIMADGIDNTYRVPVLAWATGSDGTTISDFNGWLFKGCFVQNVGDIGFDYSNGDPIIVSITMGYTVMEDLV